MQTAPLAKAIERCVEHARGKDVIMIGEATHGTSEFYVWRAQITRALIEAYDVDFLSRVGRFQSRQLL